MAAINESPSPAALRTNIAARVDRVILGETPPWMAITDGFLCLMGAYVARHE